MSRTFRAYWVPESRNYNVMCWKCNTVEMGVVQAKLDDHCRVHAKWWHRDERS